MRAEPPNHKELQASAHGAEELRCETLSVLFLLVVCGGWAEWREGTRESPKEASGYRRITGGFPERSKGSDCKSDGNAFAGSNPAPPIYDARTIRYLCRTTFIAGVAQW